MTSAVDEKLFLLERKLCELLNTNKVIKVKVSNIKHSKNKLKFCLIFLVCLTAFIPYYLCDFLPPNLTSSLKREKCGS